MLADSFRFQKPTNAKPETVEKHLTETNEKILSIILFAFLIVSYSQNSQFAGTWYNNSNYCDSLMIYKGETKMIFEYNNAKYPVEEKNGYLEINGEETSKISLGDKNELLINGAIFSKKVNELDLNGEWKIYECAEKFEWSGITVKNDTLTISYGSPLEIIATKNKISNDTIAVYYAYGAGTISMMNIVDNMRDKVDYEIPIAYILPKSENHFNFVWNGISVKGQEDKWLDYLDDEIYWGERAQEYEYELIFVRE